MQVQEAQEVEHWKTGKISERYQKTLNSAVPCFEYVSLIYIENRFFSSPESAAWNLPAGTRRPEMRMQISAEWRASSLGHEYMYSAVNMHWRRA